MIPAMSPLVEGEKIAKGDQASNRCIDGNKLDKSNVMVFAGSYVVMEGS